MEQTSSSETFKAYITKYALTSGIFWVNVRNCASDSQMVRNADNEHSFYHGEGKEWHRSWERALARAEEMRKKKISRLQAEIAKLEKLEFTDPAHAHAGKAS